MQVAACWAACPAPGHDPLGSQFRGLAASVLESGPRARPPWPSAAIVEPSHRAPRTNSTLRCTVRPGPAGHLATTTARGAMSTTSSTREHRKHPLVRVGAALLVTCLAIASLSALSIQVASATTQASFTTQGCSTWSVPSGVTTVQISAVAAAGGPGATFDSEAGGFGGTGDGMSASLTGLTPGQALDVCVDYGGGSGKDSNAGQGGGASGVSLGSTFSSRSSSRPVAAEVVRAASTTATAPAGAAGTPARRMARLVALRRGTREASCHHQLVARAARRAP